MCKYRKSFCMISTCKPLMLFERIRFELLNAKNMIFLHEDLNIQETQLGIKTKAT